MGIENSARYSGPISVNEKITGFHDPKLRFLESYPNERGYIMMSGLFLSAIEQEKENMIGYIVFSWISPNNIACLNGNYVIKDHVKHVPDEARNLFLTEEIWCSKLAFLVISEENRGKGVGRFLFWEGVKHVKEMGIRQINIQSAENSLNFYKKCGAIPQDHRLFLTLDTKKISQYEDYLKEVVQR